MRQKKKQQAKRRKAKRENRKMLSDTMDQKFLNIPTKALVASIIIHLSVPLLFFGFQALEKIGILSLPRKKMDLHEAYQNFIQVDVVALPDELPQQKNQIDALAPVVEKPAAATEPLKFQQTEADLIKTADEALKKEALKKEAQKKREEQAHEKIRKKESDKALKKIKEEAEREAALKSILLKDGKVGRKKLAGNILSKGTSASGKVGTAEDQYYNIIVQAIKAHFKVYPWQIKKKLVAVVRIELYPNGRVRSREIIKTSADKTYDSAVLNAVDEAQPLPLPADLEIIADGINVTMTPE